jgi:uncharacterized repeat protein (TIGR01451 family)
MNMNKFPERRDAWLKRILCVMVLLLMPAIQARAETKGGVVLKTVAEVETVVVAKNGEKRIVLKDVSKTSIYPGDTVVFTTTCENKAEKPATGLVIKNPVPDNMVYLAGTAEGADAGITFSVDKGKTFDVPAKLKVIQKDGKKRSATPSDYTHIKLSFSKPLAPGAVKTVSFKAKVK